MSFWEEEIWGGLIRNYAVAFMEKLLQFFFCGCMGNPGSFFRLRNRHRQDICHSAFSEIFDKEDNEWREGEELPTSESILIDTKDYPMELFIEEILSITAI